MVRQGAGPRFKPEEDRSGAVSMLMHRRDLWLVAGAAVALALSPARAEDTVKIGLILPMTGGQASTGKQIDNAIKLYMQQHGDTVAGKKIEVILKDDAAVPDN